MPPKDLALAFLSSRTTGVLSFIEHEAPHASTVFFMGENDFRIHFTTKITSTKFRAIEKNPRVAFTIYDDETPRQLQIEGTATRLATDASREKEMVDAFIKAHSAKYPAPITQLDDAEIAFMVITPQLVRWGNFAYGAKGTKNVLVDIPLD